MNYLYQEIQAKSALNRLKNKRLPYRWDLNIYRGCAHKCSYCYALYSHKYLNSDNFFNEIFIKTNIDKRLEEKLSSKRWKKEVINIGSVCDSYQPIEAKYKMMRRVLKLMIKYRNPVVISTKSSLILRDLDLIDKLSRLTYVGIGFTVTAGFEDLRKKIEPFSSPVQERFRALKEIGKTKAVTGLHAMPILPFITDRKKNLEKLFFGAKKAKVDYTLVGLLNLRGETRDYFLNFIKSNFPDLYFVYLKLYRGGRLNQEYKRRFYQLVSKFKKRHNLE